jgi:hypothetical protein
VLIFFVSLSFFFVGWGLNSGLRACKAGALLLEPPVHSALVILEMDSPRDSYGFHLWSSLRISPILRIIVNPRTRDVAQW